MSYVADKNQQTTAETIPAALRFPEQAKASVVQSRESAVYYPTSGMHVKSSENRNTIFRLSSSSFLDPKTARLEMRVSVPDYKIRVEDMTTSLISSITLQAGGVELESIQHVGDQVRLNVYNSCPGEVYRGHFANTMGAWKHVPKKRANIYHTTGAALTMGGDYKQTQVDTGSASGRLNEIVVGQMYDETSWPMADAENPYAVDWRGDGKKGYTVAIPLSLILSFFATEQYIPLSFLGSLDIHINWEQFERCCVIAAGFNRDGTSGIMTPELESGTLGTDALLKDVTLKYYEIHDIVIKTDLIDLDRSYLAMLGSLISSSAAGLTIPYTSHSNQQVTFTPTAENTLYQSRGFSYLQKAFFAFRNAKVCSNPYLVKSNYCFGDSFRSFQAEVGSKLYPNAPIRSSCDAYQHLLIASDQHQSVDQGGLHTYESYNSRPNQFQTNVQTPVDPTQAVPLMEPHRAPNQTFCLGMNFEKAQGKHLTDGISLRLSGYSLMTSIGLATSAQATVVKSGLDLNNPVPLLKEPNGPLFGEQMQMTSVLRVLKSLTLRSDAVSVSE